MKFAYSMVLDIHYFRNSSDLHFSESGSTERKEEAIYMKFLKYMEELEGTCVYHRVARLYM